MSLECMNFMLVVFFHHNLMRFNIFFFFRAVMHKMHFLMVRYDSLSLLAKKLHDYFILVLMLLLMLRHV